MKTVCVYHDLSAEIDHEATGEKMRKRIASRHLSQKEFAPMLGITEARLSEFLNGKRKWTEALARRFMGALES
jgi:plasmid maintenance system antidote protein VapI